MSSVTITRRIHTIQNEIYRSILTRQDFENKIAELKSEPESRRPFISFTLWEMFTALGIPCDKNCDPAHYEMMMRTEKLPEFRDAEKQIMQFLYDYLDKYLTPEEYMLRIVNRLEDPEDGWQNDTLRLRILKRFIKYGNCLSFKFENRTVRIYNGEPYLRDYVKQHTGQTPKDHDDLLKGLDDGVFGALATAAKEEKKPSKKYGLLRLADDLASGKFKAEGATKRELYLFGMVYDMTFSCSDPDQPMTATALIDYDSDIEKNLFEDYYANNLMRFLTAPYMENLSAYEQDPSGQGINYKNFAEMVYLYYIVQDLPAAEKLRRSYQMIERLKKSDFTPKHEDNNTKSLTDLFTDVIFRKSESDFEKLVGEMLVCDTRADRFGNRYASPKGEMQIETAQNTAFGIYQKLCACTAQMLHNMSVPGQEFTLANCNYGLWFVDVSYILNTNQESLQEFAKGKDPEKVDELVNLLRSINRFIGRDASHRNVNLMNIASPEKMTRTALVTAYYYYYNTVSETQDAGKCFTDVMNDFTDLSIGLEEWDGNPQYLPGLNALLNEAGYQPVNDRNIFDLAVIFSAYSYQRRDD